MYFLATKLKESLVNEKITASCHTSMSPMALYQNVTNTKRELWKTDRLTSSKTLNTIRLDLLQVCPPAHPFRFVVSFNPFF